MQTGHLRRDLRGGVVVRFRTRKLELEAVQWTGVNQDEIGSWMEAHFGRVGWEHSSPAVWWLGGSAQPGEWLCKFDDADDLPQVRNNLLFLVKAEPVPGLIRTVEDYEGLPDAIEVAEWVKP